MGWYEALKDGISVAQKADNLQLVRDLLEAQQQIFDLVNENNQLKEEIKRLNEVGDIEENHGGSQNAAVADDLCVDDVSDADQLKN